MLQFSANLSMLFTDVGFLERFAKASNAGFRAVECQFPYQYGPDALCEQLHRYGLIQVLHNMPAGDWASGERGIACLPDRVGEFQDGVGRAMDYAAALGCTRLNCLAGVAPAAADRAKLHETFIDNLRFAACELNRRDMTLVIEPLNTRDTPGFFLQTSQQAIAVIDEVGADNLHLQFDVYHAHIMEGDVVASLQRALRHIAHVQVADDPGRHEPGTGGIDYSLVFQTLETGQYGGWVGCEYVPLSTTEDSLKWLHTYLGSSRL
jgi:hydroxypyruvate isomerase